MDHRLGCVNSHHQIARISNAFKFTFEGEIGIAAKPSSDGRFAEVTVRDTGTLSRFNALLHCYTEAKQQFASHRAGGSVGSSGDLNFTDVTRGATLFQPNE